MKANLFKSLVVVLPVMLVAVAVALFGVGLRTAETQTTTPEMQVQDLGRLGGGSSGATGINDTGQVVGYSYLNACYGGEHAFLYDTSAATPKMQDLGTLGSYRSEAKGINDFGQVVGQADDPEYWELFGVCGNYACQRAFLYEASANPKMQNLRTLLGDIIPMAVFGSGAWDINNSGQVVGMSASDVRQEAPHGFLYDATAATPKMIDLNTLIPADSGWTITSASAINSEGQVAATGRKVGVGTHALLLTPTSGPDPLKIISPLNNTLYDPDGSFRVSGTAPAGSTVELFEDTASKGTTKADASSGIWSIDLSGVSEGVHTYTAKATDAASNTSYTSNSVTVTVDKTAPNISEAYPAGGATKVLRNTDIAASFTEKMDPATFTTSTVTLVKEGTTTPIGIRMGLMDSFPKLWISPWVELDANTKYTVKIKGGTNGVKDLAGNALGQDYSWTFTTVDVPPTVVSYTPTDTTGVPRSISPTATFSTNMDASTITATNIKFEVYNTKRSRWISVTHTVSYDDPTSKTATVIPGSTLAASKDYRVTVTTSVKSSTGVALDQDANTSGNQPKSWTFTTGSS